MKKRYLRLISVFLVSVIAICALPVSATATNIEPEPIVSQSETVETLPSNDYETHTDILDYDNPDVSTPIIEIESRREENVKHFILPDGSIEAVIYGNAVHRKGSDGEWKDIDNNLSDAYSKTSNTYSTKDQRVVFSKNFSAGENILTLNENGYSIGLSLIQEQLNVKATDKAVSPTLSTAKITNSKSRSDIKTWNSIEEARSVNNNSSILYSNVRENTDLEYILDGNNVKENIIVRDKCDSYIYTFELELLGLTPILNKDGSIVLSDSDTGESKYSIPAPYMYDADGEYSYDVYYTLSEKKEGVYTFKVIADSEWINAESRTLPVTIDPSIEKDVVFDTYIDSGNSSENYGTSTTLWVSSTKIPFLRMAMQTTPTIPSNATIISAYFHIAYYYYSNVTSNSLTAGAYMITSPWSESDVTWDTANAYSNLGISTTQLSTASFPGNAGAYSSTPKWVQFDVTSAVTEWHNGTPNYGIAIKRLSGTNSSVILKAGESGTTYRPYFTITYTELSITNGVYKIKNTATGKYIDVTDSGTSSGTQLQQWSGTTYDGNRAQLFKITFIQYSNTYNYYTIRPLTNCGQGINIPTSGTATVETLQTEDIWSNTPWNQSIAIIDEGDSFALKSGTATAQQYLTAPSSGTNGTKLYTASSFTTSSGWVFEEYSTAIDGASFTNFCHYLVPNETYTYQAVMYSSTIGRNGPATYLVRNEDGTATDKATINASTGQLTALKPGKVRVGTTYAGTNSYWYRILTITEDMSGKYYIKNASTAKYITASTTSGSSSVEQWDFSHGLNQGWELIHIELGYYKIKDLNSEFYLTSPVSNVSGALITSENLLNADNIDRQLWRIILTTDGSYQIKAKNRNTFVLSSPSSSVSDGANISQQNEDNGNITKWNIAHYDAFSKVGGVATTTVEFRCVGTLTTSSTWLPLIHNAASAWNGSGAGTNLSITTSGTSQHTITVESNDETWYGSCVKKPSGNVIATSSTITINLRTLPNNNNTRQSTIAHEMAHVLWLSDNPVVSSGNESLMRGNRDRTIVTGPQTYDIHNVVFWYN